MTEEHSNSPVRPEGSALDDAALDSWRVRATEKRTARRARGLRGAWDTYRAWPVWQRVAVAAPAVLVAALFLGALIDGVASLGRIHPGVTAAGIPIGGLSRDAAAERLATELQARLAEPVTVAFEETTWTVTAEEIAAVPDGPAAAELAFRVGRSGDVLGAIAQRMSLWFVPLDVDVPVSSDTSATTALIASIAEEIDRDPLDATIVIEDLTPRIEPASLGLAVQVDVLEADILDAIVAEERRVDVNASFVPVRVTDEGARDALGQVERMLAGPVSVTYEAKSWEFGPERIAEWIGFRIAGSAAEPSAESSPAGVATQTAPSGESSGTAVLEAFIDADEASATISAAVGEAGRPAVDASFKVSSGRVTIVPSQDGTGPDIETLAREMTIVLKGSGDRTLELKTQRLEPELTTEEAQGMGIKERISTYTTNYDSSNKPRVNNIHTLADAIDGTLVGPGETFSFNETVGPRTAAKGYQEANAIVNGKLVPQLGGGICQFGTTIFNAVFESGLPIVERKNHSYYIASYPDGRDATVSWGGPDFKFKNDTGTWVLIATGYSNSSVTVSLYGTDPGYEVKAQKGPWTGVTTHPVKEIDDPTLPVGRRVVEETGHDGRTIVIKRTVTKNGQVVREDSFKSVYKTIQEVVRVGTMPVPSTDATPVATP